jgi:hypothetical protein
MATTTSTQCPPTPSSTPYPEDTSVYFGWYSEAAQQLRISNQADYIFNVKRIKSPPYCYWMQGDKKVLITEVTHTSIPTPRQKANGDVCVGQLDKYFGRSYSKL